jgi:hypothetical protein
MIQCLLAKSKKSALYSWKPFFNDIKEKLDTKRAAFKGDTFLRLIVRLCPSPSMILYNTCTVVVMYISIKLQLQYWPKVTHAKKRTSHAGCNICVGCARDAAPAACDTRVGCALLTRLLRVCRPFMYCRCRALLVNWKCARQWVTFGQYCTSHNYRVTQNEIHE